MGKYTQPPPRPSTHPDVCDMVRDDLAARKEEGRAKYGTPLRGHNGRDALRDAYEEALDLVQYLRQAIYERETTPCDAPGAVLAAPSAQTVLCPSWGPPRQQGAAQEARDPLPACPRCAGTGVLDYPGVPDNCYYCGGLGLDTSRAPAQLQQMVHALRNRTGVDLPAAWDALRDADYNPARAEDILRWRMTARALKENQ